MSQYAVPVVKVVSKVVNGNPHGYTEINKSDFNPEIHELFEGEHDPHTPVETGKQRHQREKAEAKAAVEAAEKIEADKLAEKHKKAQDAKATPGWGAAPKA